MSGIARHLGHRLGRLSRSHSTKVVLSLNVAQKHLDLLKEMIIHFDSLISIFIRKAIGGFPTHLLRRTKCLNANASITDRTRAIKESLQSGMKSRSLSEMDLQTVKRQTEKLQNTAAILSACFLNYENELDGLLTWLNSVSSSADWSISDKFDISEVFALVKQLEDNVTEFRAHYKNYLAGNMTKATLANMTVDRYHLGGLSARVKSLIDLLQTTFIDTLKSIIASKQEQIIYSYIEMLQKLVSVRKYLSSEDKLMTRILRGRKIWQIPRVNLQSPQVQICQTGGNRETGISLVRME